jgi:hypothetical protein
MEAALIRAAPPQRHQSSGDYSEPTLTTRVHEADTATTVRQALGPPRDGGGRSTLDAFYPPSPSLA